jgi:DNA-binding MarR family transcriptional regulator
MHLIDFKILNTAIERLLNKELSEFGITYTQATVIGYLKRNIDKEICQKDIEYNLGLTTPTVCSILSRMEEKQMISTHPSKADRRYKSISLTPQAVEMAEDISVRIDSITAKLFFGISEDDKNVTGETIKKIIKNMALYQQRVDFSKEICYNIK